MKQQLQPIRGTKDLIGDEALLYNTIISIATGIAERYCYNYLSTPIFENSAIFHRTLGESSDIVNKETYTFLDRDKTSITLRPEFTAAIARALISNGLTQSLPVRFFSHGPVFRHERPQNLRYRQFHQLNFESFGDNNPASDAEMIALAYDIIKTLNINTLVKLEINTVGDIESRKSYSIALVKYLSQYQDQLSSDSIKRLVTNPMRILDSKDENDKRIIINAPSILEYLSKEASKYYEDVLGYLSHLKIPYTTNTKIVRGLDYYTHTVFEFTTDQLGSQGTVLAGGRYNGLVSIMGGPEIPAIGCAGGIERIMELYKKSNTLKKLQEIHIIPIGMGAETKALILAQELRNKGFKIYLGYDMNLKKRMNYANKVNAKAVIIFGDDEMNRGEYQVKNMIDGTQRTINQESLIELLSTI